MEQGAYDVESDAREDVCVDEQVDEELECGLVE